MVKFNTEFKVEDKEKYDVVFVATEQVKNV